MAKIFISYRRADSASPSGRIYDRLVERFGKKNVFKDVDDIPPGVNFATYIQQSLAESAVALVIIGRTWTSVRDQAGNRRLDDPNDFVRLEVETAQRLGLTVIPVLVEGATMPRRTELPPSLQSFALINGLPVRNDPDFSHDMERLIAALARLLPARGPLGLFSRRPSRQAPRSTPLTPLRPGTPASTTTAAPTVALAEADTATQAVVRPAGVDRAPAAPETPAQERGGTSARAVPTPLPASPQFRVAASRLRTARTAWVAGLAAVLVVSSLGVLLTMQGGPRDTGSTHAPDTAATRTEAAVEAAVEAAANANLVTQTAITAKLANYTAAAPGPGCDTGGAQWEGFPQGSQYIVCEPTDKSPYTYTHLTARVNTSGTVIQTSLQGAPLKQSYTISITFAHLTPCASFQWQANPTIYTDLYLDIQGSGDSSCPDGAGTYGFRRCLNQACTDATGSYDAGLPKHIITASVNNSQVQVLLDNKPLATYQESRAPTWFALQFTVSQGLGDTPDSVDLSDFSVRPG